MVEACRFCLARRPGTARRPSSRSMVLVLLAVLSASAWWGAAAAQEDAVKPQGGLPFRVLPEGSAEPGVHEEPTRGETPAVRSGPPGIPGESPHGAEGAARGPSDLFQPAFSAISQWQRELRELLTRFGRVMRTDPHGRAFRLFWALSFAYGVVHALGPGHGKSVVCSFFLGRRGSYLQGVLMASLISLVHVGSAVALVFTFLVLFRGAGMGAMEDAGAGLQRVSYGLLTGLGLFLAGSRFIEWSKGGLPEGAGCAEGQGARGSMILAALATGLVPCPGAAVVLIFSVSQQQLASGLVAMAAIALGMGLTTSVFATAGIAARGAILGASSRSRGLLLVTGAVLSLGGALAIAGIGGLMLLHSL